MSGKSHTQTSSYLRR